MIWFIYFVSFSGFADEAFEIEVVLIWRMLLPFVAVTIRIELSCWMLLVLWFDVATVGVLTVIILLLLLLLICADVVVVCLLLLFFFNTELALRAAAAFDCLLDNALACWFVEPINVLFIKRIIFKIKFKLLWKYVLKK